MRDTKQLHPNLQLLIQKLKEECEKQGLKIAIGECLRTVAEQNALYAIGRTTELNRSTVTNCKGSTYSSMHQWGVAFDFYRNDGSGAFEDKDGFFTKVGKIGQTLGLEWGGVWSSFPDKPHFQLRDWGSTATRLKQSYGTPDKFIATWSGQSATSTNSTTPQAAAPVQESKPVNSNINIAHLQGALNADGIIDSDGNKLAEDGIWGAKTESAVNKVMLSTKTMGRYVNVTAWVQCRVGTTADGLFGSNTKVAVANYQIRKGISADGIAGPVTVKTIVQEYVAV